MLIIMQSGCSRADLDRVRHVAEGIGLSAETLPFEGGMSAVAVSGYKEMPSPALFEALPRVLQVRGTSRGQRRSDRSARPEGTVIRVGGTTIGDGGLTLIAGPCAVEDGESLVGLASRLRAAGAGLLRGGAWKPRTSPYDFQGLGEEGLRHLARAREATRLPVISEAVDEASLERVEAHADVIQIGARNMQNFSLLRRAGRSAKPVFLKRGFSATLDDLVNAAEYVLAEGNGNVMLCERGIRTFSDHSRFTLDLSIVPRLKKLTHLPVFVDPSHASGDRDSVAPLARAAVAVGADGVMLEVHPDPAHALCDGPQSLGVDEFVALAAELRDLAARVARPRETVT